MEVQLIRQLLEQLLDYHYDFYVGKLRDWFANRMSKEQFDTEMSSVLRGEVLQLHNQLLMAILLQSTVNITNTPQHQPKNETLALHYPSVPSSSERRPSQFAIQQFPSSIEDAQNEGGTAGDSTLIFKIQPLTAERVVDTSSRFPEIFMSGEFHTYPAPGRNRYCEVQPDFHEILRSKETELKNNHRASLYGRFLMDAWRLKLDNVQPNAFNFAVATCVDHIKNVIIAIIKQRKAFRVRDGRYIHSIGAPYPNPYLLQGQHIFDETYSSETAKLADVMQIPAFLPTREEKERLAALEVSASVPSKYPHLKSKSSLSDFLDAMQCDRKLIPLPNSIHGSRLREIILQKSKGYGDAYSSYEGSRDLVAKTVYPVILY